MRNWRRLPLVGAALVSAASALVMAAAPTAADTYSPRVGEQHPEFTLPAIDDGRPLSLAGYRGRKVLLIQFASW